MRMYVLANLEDVRLVKAIQRNELIKLRNVQSYTFAAYEITADTPNNEGTIIEYERPYCKVHSMIDYWSQSLRLTEQRKNHWSEPGAQYYKKIT